jgi:EpsI family protein
VGLDRSLLLWHRYWVGGRYTTDRFVATLLELRERMLTGKDDAALIVMLAPYSGRSSDAAEADLTDFLSVAAPPVDALLKRTAGHP